MTDTDQEIVDFLDQPEKEFIEGRPRRGDFIIGDAAGQFSLAEIVKEPDPHANSGFSIVPIVVIDDMDEMTVYISTRSDEDIPPGSRILRHAGPQRWEVWMVK